MKAKLIRDIALKTGRTEAEVRIVVNKHLSALNRKVQENRNFNLKIPHFGRVHTHGNAKDIRKIKVNNRMRKIMKERYDFSDSKLLF